MSLSEIRTLYKMSYNNSDKADLLVQHTEKQVSDGVYLAYHATGLAFQAKNGWNPATKLSKAKAAYSELNKAVNLLPNNLEVRFLRFSFESAAPDFLGYNNHLNADKAELIRLKDTKHPLWPWMHAFFAQCEKLNTSEKSQL